MLFVSLVAHWSDPITPIPAGLIAIGLGLTLWARHHLAENWTPDVQTPKRIVISGPYRWVNHPIYWGIEIAYIGTALALGTVWGWIAAVLIGVGHIIKARQEDALMP